jgi:hypothetical protein
MYSTVCEERHVHNPVTEVKMRKTIDGRSVTKLEYYSIHKYHTMGTIPKSNRKIVEIRTIVTPNTHHDSSLFWLLNKKWRG